MFMDEELAKFTDEVSKIHPEMIRRFKDKQLEGREGWNQPQYIPGMFQAAASKLLKLTEGESENPAKDCADICNFAIFFKVIAESST